MGLREVKKELETLDREQLMHHIIALYKKHKPVKEYFDFFANPVEENILERYKERVREGFYPARGWRLKLYRSRKAINEFKKLAISPEAITDLQLYFTEVAIEYARDKRPRTEPYYERLHLSFKKALEYIRKEGLDGAFYKRCESIMARCERLPWNTHERMKEHLEGILRTEL